jgi:hypothetical protein
VDLSDRLPVKIETIQDLNTLGKLLYGSGFFKDVAGASQAIVKVLAGAEIGLGPIASMTSIYIVEGKPSFSSNLIASKIKSHSEYDYKVESLDDKHCKVGIYQMQPAVSFREGEAAGSFQKIGDFEFTQKDAQAAGLTGKNNWKKYPKAMYFSRAISQAARVFCPDVFHSVIPYTVEELAPDVELTDSGDIVEGQFTEPEIDVPQDSTEGGPEIEPEAGTDELTPDDVSEGTPTDQEDVPETPSPPAGPPEGKPWLDPALTIAENRNILYGIAVTEWNYEDTDAVRETIIEANRWTGNPPIPDLDTLDDIATHLLEQSAEPEEVPED